MRWPHTRVDRASPPPYVGTERRRTPRYYVQLPVESARGTGATLDVNEDGVRFETNHRFVYGEVLTLRLVFRHIAGDRSEEHTSELQSHSDLVCRLLLEKKKK